MPHDDASVSDSDYGDTSSESSGPDITLFPAAHQTTSAESSNNLQGSTDLRDDVLRVLSSMDALGMTFESLVDAVLWGDKECTKDARIWGARTTLMNGKKLAGVIQRIWKPPNSGMEERRGRVILKQFFTTAYNQILSEELENLAQIFVSEKGKDVAEEVLENLNFESLVKEIPWMAPNLWAWLEMLAQPVGERAQARTKKDPKKTIIMVLAMLSFSRSHHRNLFQKALGIFVKFRGLSSRAYDTLHALGIIISHKWTTEAVERMSKASMADVLRLMNLFQWLLSYDNLQVAFRVFSQRLDNMREFGNGCAATIYIKRDAQPFTPTANRQFQAHRATGLQNPLTSTDIQTLANKHEPIIHERMVLRILLDSPEFDLPKYCHRKSEHLKVPEWIRALPFGPDHRTLQYLLGSVNIPEASYDDNMRLLREWLRQLERDTPDAHRKLGLEELIAFCGDQLTIDRLRGLWRFRAGDSNSFERMDWMLLIFGWFHLQMAHAQSIFKQYHGTLKGDSLLRAFSALKRKGLQTASIKGPFHHSLEEALFHVAEAHLLVDWKVVADVKLLAELRAKEPGELLALARQIVRDRASTGALNRMDLRAADNEGAGDAAARQSAMFSRDMLQYIVLDEAIKHGDIGMMEAMLPTLFFRFTGGRNNKYALQVLELLQGLEREWTEEVKEYVRLHCWLLNFSGKQNSFLPVDLAQEHNIKDIKVTYRSQGAKIDWAYLKKLHPAIPFIHALCEHMEEHFGTRSRGKKHTTPRKLKDVQMLMELFQESRVHEYIAGRKVTGKSTDVANDVFEQGQIKAQSGDVLQKWINNRNFVRSTEEDWEDT